MVVPRADADDRTAATGAGALSWAVAARSVRGFFTPWKT
jgi:hypothetical protein